MNAKKRIEEQGRAPLLGWAQNRRIQLFHTDVKSTWEKVREERRKREASNDASGKLS